jgi:hypothetical protein
MSRRRCDLEKIPLAHDEDVELDRLLIVAGDLNRMRRVTMRVLFDRDQDRSHEIHVELHGSDWSSVTVGRSRSIGEGCAAGLMSVRSISRQNDIGCSARHRVVGQFD